MNENKDKVWPKVEVAIKYPSSIPEDQACGYLIQLLKQKGYFGVYQNTRTYTPDKLWGISVVDCYAPEEYVDQCIIKFNDVMCKDPNAILRTLKPKEFGFSL